VTTTTATKPAAKTKAAETSAAKADATQAGYGEGRRSVLFHSLQFLLFLPAVLAAWWAAVDRPTLRKVILVAASLIFYMAWNPAPVVLLLYLTLIDWVVGRALAREVAVGRRKLLLLLSVVNNLFLLGLFKYADWLTRIVVDVAAQCGVRLVYQPLGLLLPVGLSFIVFQGMSYTIDIYRRELSGRRSLLDVMVFMTFFPHVVAGPIVRAADFLPQVDERPRLDDDSGGRALFRILTGLFKKLVIADFLETNLVSRVFANPDACSGLEVVAGVVGYTFQIYYDFSAYSDIAIGTAALFGFTLKENFDKPYLSPNLFEFWRRWHISLGTWLRDYLYVPLGGNRGGRLRTVVNLMITMVLGGVWHGADGRFVLWGFAHGVGLTLTRLWWWTFGRNRSPSAVGTVLATAITFAVVVQMRIVFRAADVDHAVQVFLAQARHWEGGTAPLLQPAVVAVGAAAVVGHLLPHAAHARAAATFARAPLVVRIAVLVILAVFIRQVNTAEAQPFIYSRF
jgi:D-alanyl-lipoteichoic acid acyltransferase DltB (MBOAT superfamily)